MEIIWSKPFEADVKYYFKKKRYTKILDDIDKATIELQAGNFIGDKLEGLPIPANTAVQVPFQATTQAVVIQVLTLLNIQ